MPRCSRNCRKRWQRVFRADNFYSSIRLIIMLAFLQGLTPYYVGWDEQQAELSLRESKLGFVNAFARFLFAVYCYAYSQVHNEYLIGYFMRTDISQSSSHVHNTVGMLAGVMIFILPLWQRRSWRKSIELLSAIDRRLAKLRIRINYFQVQYLGLLVVLLAFALDAFIILVCWLCFAKMQVQASWPFVLIMIGEVLTLSMVVTMFCLLTHSVQRRLQRLHKVSANLWKV
ncbi:uncharacterized protein LOC108606239 [Drosophila busckii]|uniref:uncharacterized protein LOC108606239 n=1 Tax=Drosophila busckii TaxID=30019 RepID=UPI00083E9877|nr:uncharacterized protein LOC108606239 [Drosophila busckii]